VLLHGVNDNSAILCQLSEDLFDNGIQPYYLHMFDKVQGVAHFDVDEAKAKVLITEMMARLPGFLVPKLVREIAGEANKTPINLA
jgi:L-lysine 2,3-aminomutase